MKIKPALLLGLILVFISGCGSLPYQGYTGPQNWPTSTGSFSRTKNGVAIYNSSDRFGGWPEKPYSILGKVDLVGDSTDDLINILANVVRQHRGEAGIIYNEQFVHAGDRYTPGQMFIFGNPSNNSMWGFSTPGHVEPITHFVAIGYAIEFHNSLQTQLNNLDYLIQWAKTHPGGGVFEGVNYSAEQINAAQRNLLTNFTGWIEWCNEHPSGGTFTNNNGQVVEVLVGKVPSVRKELRKQRDQLESQLK